MKRTSLKFILILTLALFFYDKVLASEVTGSIGGGVVSPVVVINAPVVNPSSGTYGSAQNVTLTASGASSIRFTINGDTPNCSSETYLNPIAVNSSLTIKAISCYPGNQSSEVVSFAYTISIPPANTDTNSSSGGGSSGSRKTNNSPIVDNTYVAPTIPVIVQTNSYVNNIPNTNKTNKIIENTILDESEAPVSSSTPSFTEINNDLSQTAALGDVPFGDGWGSIWIIILIIIILAIILYALSRKQRD